MPPWLGREARINMHDLHRRVVAHLVRILYKT
jgi:hypothetical protein